MGGHLQAFLLSLPIDHIIDIISNAMILVLDPINSLANCRDEIVDAIRDVTDLEASKRVDLEVDLIDDCIAKVLL